MASLKARFFRKLSSNNTGNRYTPDLPDSVLIEVFTHVSLLDRFALEHVSRTWLTAVRKSYSTCDYLKLDCSDLLMRFGIRPNVLLLTEHDRAHDTEVRVFPPRLLSKLFRLIATKGPHRLSKVLLIGDLTKVLFFLDYRTAKVLFSQLTFLQYLDYRGVILQSSVAEILCNYKYLASINFAHTRVIETDGCLDEAVSATPPKTYDQVTFHGCDAFARRVLSYVSSLTELCLHEVRCAIFVDMWSNNMETTGFEGLKKLVFVNHRHEHCNEGQSACQRTKIFNLIFQNFSHLQSLTFDVEVKASAAFNMNILTPDQILKKPLLTELKLPATAKHGIEIGYYFPMEAEYIAQAWIQHSECLTLIRADNLRSISIRICGRSIETRMRNLSVSYPNLERLEITNCAQFPGSMFAFCANFFPDIKCLSVKECCMNLHSIIKAGELSYLFANSRKLETLIMDGFFLSNDLFFDILFESGLALQSIQIFNCKFDVSIAFLKHLPQKFLKRSSPLCIYVDLSDPSVKAFAKALNLFTKARLEELGLRFFNIAGA